MQIHGAMSLSLTEGPWDRTGGSPREEMTHESFRKYPLAPDPLCPALPFTLARQGQQTGHNTSRTHQGGWGGSESRLCHPTALPFLPWLLKSVCVTLGNVPR